MRNFPATKFAGKKSSDLVFSNVDRYGYRVGVIMLFHLYRRKKIKRICYGLHSMIAKPSSISNLKAFG